KLGGETVLQAPNYHNLFIGSGVAVNNTGNSNTMVGVNSGNANTSGALNTFMGVHTGFYNESGSGNTFMGFYSGGNNTSGDYNTFIGDSSGRFNLTGYENVFVGVSAGFLNSSGYYNTIVGGRAGTKNTTGSFNTFLGYYTGINNDIGNGNTFLGSQAGLRNESGESNTYVGIHSGRLNITGHHNTAIGFGSGYNNVGSNNVFIGYYAGYNEIGTNKLYIANGPEEPNTLIYGDFISRQVGIGTSSPSAALHVDGDVKVGYEDGYYLGGYSGLWWDSAAGNVALGTTTSAGLAMYGGDTTARMVIEGGTGNVGVGITSPDYILDIEDDSSSYIVRMLNSNTGTSADVLALQVGGTGNPTSGNDFIKFINGSGTLNGSIEGNGNGGIRLTSAAADFAEWMVKLDADEVLASGDVVGVFGGAISHRTAGADQVMVVSSAPIVLGNSPDQGKKHLYAAVALLGQAPVKVAGRVKKGDYIVASGQADGLGIAVTAKQLTPDQYTQIVGQAWESSENPGFKKIMVSIGLRNGQEIFGRIQKESQDNRRAIQALEEDVSGLLGQVDELKKKFAVLEQVVQNRVK
ncbi:MAG: hypothetical protein GY869_24735, partial [Planctomycetes bacterium]|nr:hypothetical protein [Planctomycetota bacterium]